jgi:hypothetical protein
MVQRLRSVGPTVILSLLTLILGSLAAVGLWLQPQSRSSSDTATVLFLVVIVGAPLVGITIWAMARAPWPEALKVAAITAYVVMVASFSMLYMIYSMPDWLTIMEQPPGAPSAHRVLTDIAHGLEIVGWFGVLGTAAVLAALLLGALAAPYSRASANNHPLSIER